MKKGVGNYIRRFNFTWTHIFFFTNEKGEFCAGKKSFWDASINEKKKEIKNLILF